jgi:hypothetical protein
VTTVLHAVSVVDQITALPAEGIGCEVTGDGAAEVPTDVTNLAVARRRGSPSRPA